MTGALAATLRARPPAVIAIGASAGAVQALGRLLPALPAGLPVPVLIVVHVPADRTSALPDVFARTCRLSTVEVEDKMMPLASTVYFASPDYHLLVERDGSLALSVDEPVNHSRPSIDVLFDSVAIAHRAQALGILLSGASRDGAEGLARMREAGAHTWVQDPTTAQAALMPRSALLLAPHQTLEPSRMGWVLAEWVAGRG